MGSGVLEEKGPYLRAEGRLRFVEAGYNAADFLGRCSSAG